MNKTELLIDIFDLIDTSKFPLTMEMCDKNDYNDAILHLYQDENGKPVGVAIYEVYPNDYCYLSSFEIDKTKRGNYYGTAFMDILQNKFKTIKLHCMPGVEHFYIQCGFVPAEEKGYFVWTRSY